MKKVPYGIIASVCAMITFFATAGLILAYFILNGVAAETGDTVSFLADWWQIVLFVADLLSAIAAVACLVLFLLRRRSEESRPMQFPKKIFKRSTWTMLTVFFAVLLATVCLGNSIANDYQVALNSVMHTNPYDQVETGADENEDKEYFKSDYVNADGSYNDRAMRDETERVALQTAVEGSVLLWNDAIGDGGKALPLPQGAGVSFFGIGCIDYKLLGTGSGGMSDPPPEDLRSCLSSAGLKFNTALYVRYNSLFPSYPKVNRRSVAEVPWSEIESTVSGSISAYGDAAVMIVSRVAGEHRDILPTSDDTFVDSKNYLDLSVTEADILTHLKGLRDAGSIKRIILLINTSNALQFEHIRDQYGIDACVWVGQGGMMSYRQIASVLSNTGEGVVSGHLPDTFLYKNSSAPAYVNLGDFTWTQSTGLLPNEGVMTGTHNDKYIVYQEGIYVGYRYFETRYEDLVLKRGNANGPNGISAGEGDEWSYSSEVAFPFGYGLSYTEFSYEKFSAEKHGDEYTVKMTVRNTGTQYSGKETLQVYLQKPYTEYDQEASHPIEKAAVELVGFAKTKKLAPGESEELTVTVAEEDFKTYDAYGQGTYILERGDYYLAAGRNAHDALNNILAAKGKTTADGMDENGDKTLAAKFTVEQDDYTKYSVSSATGYEIVNRFSDADPNLYEGMKDQHITYLSRKDWNGTYPEAGGAKLKCTDSMMVHDMAYGDDIEADPDDKMPVYGTVTAQQGALSLVMMMDLPYDDPLWEDLLNQMTFEEQAVLISYGLGYLAGVPSVNSPQFRARNGPVGVKSANSRLGSAISLPCEVLWAATFDTDLIHELGRAFGREILHLDDSTAVIYGPGACIHRVAESGRNFEYFSEDGVLSGKMLSVEVTGLQEFGVIVLTKHFALNDTETNRYGVTTWANEQSIREIYLKAFEPAVTVGHMNGVMSSFNRIGCIWAGAHKGLLTEVLRNEWGFSGIVESDSCTGTNGYVHHMTAGNAKPQGLLAGNDIWMCGTGEATFMDEWKDNPTVMLALRESCHRILYSQLHSCGMNGIGSGTKIVKVRVWWQKALDGIQYSLVALVCIFLAMAVASFVVNTEWFERRRAYAAERKEEQPHSEQLSEAQNGGGNDASGENVEGGKDSGGKPPEKCRPIRGKRLVIMIVCIALAVVLAVTATVLGVVLPGKGEPSASTHECGHVCPECGKCLDPACEDPACAQKCEGHAHACKQKCPVCGKCLDLTCEEEVCAEKCGEGKAEHSFEAENATLQDGAKELQIRATNGVTYIAQVNTNAGASISFTIHAETDTTASLVVTVNRRGIDVVFCDAMIVLVNSVEVTSPAVVPASETGKDAWTDWVDVDLGCVELKAGDNEIEFVVGSASQYSGFNLDKIELLSDTELTMIHTCNHVCIVCGKCTNADCQEPACAQKCTGDPHATDFEAEEASVVKGNGRDLILTAGYIERLNQNVGATVTFRIHAASAATVRLFATVSVRPENNKFTDFMTIDVNGEPFESEGTIPYAAAVSWRTFKETDLGFISLRAGDNTIVFTVVSAEDIGINFDKITVWSEVEIGAEHGCKHACPVCGKCLDPTCSDASCADKCGDGLAAHVFEAEGGNVQLVKGYRGASALPARGTSGAVTYMSGMSGNYGAELNFSVTSDRATTATLTVTVSKNSAETVFTDLICFFVNDRLIGARPAVVPAGSANDFYELTLGCVSLEEGDNLISFLCVSEQSGYACFDKIALKTEAELTPTDLSASKVYRFEAEDSRNEFTKGSATYRDGELTFGYEANSDARNKVGNLTQNVGASITFRLSAENDCTVELIVRVSKRNTGSSVFTDMVEISVNGASIGDRPAVVPQTVAGEMNYRTFTDISLGEISLRKGSNTLVYKIISEEDLGYNLDYIKLKGETRVTFDDSIAATSSALPASVPAMLPERKDF